jgi:tetratricopeptide (TPR) repeat protein
VRNPTIPFYRGITVTAFLGLVLAAPRASARYIRPDIVNVPVARLVENLQKQAEKNQKDAQARFNLARLHAMAYALKSDTAQTRRGKEDQGAWFGFAPRPIPFQVKKTDDAAKQDAARKHLEKAVLLYAEVIKLQPDNLMARLGQAWTVEQRGNKAEAIKEYRDVIERAWAKEKDMRRGRLGWHSITAEAARYLIPLLDREKDKKEIETLKERSKQVSRIPRPVTPLAIPLRDGLKAADLLNPKARVHFDVDGSALPQTWTWINRDAAWLVHDPSRSGKVTSALQLFGGVTFWCFWANGYEALASLDDDGNGLIEGKELEGLALWQDRNGNGISDPGEVRPLAEWGITALSCRFQKQTSTQCVAVSPIGVHFKDGTRRPTYDLLLQRR